MIDTAPLEWIAMNSSRFDKEDFRNTLKFYAVRIVLPQFFTYFSLVYVVNKIRPRLNMSPWTFMALRVVIPVAASISIMDLSYYLCKNSSDSLYSTLKTKYGDE